MNHLRHHWDFMAVNVDTSGNKNYCYLYAYFGAKRKSSKNGETVMMSVADP